MKFRNEQAFTDAVIDLAKMYGWLVHHDRGEMRRHIQGHIGFPDLVLVKPGVHRTVLFVELKMPKGKVSKEQYVWLYALGEWAQVWYPSDWDRIVTILAGKGKPW